MYVKVGVENVVKARHSSDAREHGFDSLLDCGLMLNNSVSIFIKNI